MDKEQLINKYISEQIFPDEIDWNRYNLNSYKGLYLSRSRWSMLYYMFSLTIEETVYYFNKWVRNQTNVGPEFSVLLESLSDP